MKKIVFFIIGLLFIGSMVSAQSLQAQQGQNINQEVQNQGEDAQLRIMEQETVTVQQIEEVRQAIQKREQEMNQEMQSMKKTEKNVYQNQNQVRLAVHSLLEIKDLVGGIGFQVSQIAQEFNNSVQATIRAEERIEKKSGFARFFTGGDQQSAELIMQEINRNQERIQQLKQLKGDCDCDEEIRNMFQEQIQNVEQEQNRLQQVVNNERQIKGIWGWIRGLFGR